MWSRSVAVTVCKYSSQRSSAGLGRRHNAERTSSRSQANDGALTGVVSFYGISSKVLNHQLHNSMRAAHLFYATSAAGGDLVQLAQDALVLLKSVSGSLDGSCGGSDELG